MNKKGRLFIFMMLMMSVIMLVSCGIKNSETNVAQSEKDGKKDSSLSYIKENKKLVLGLDASFPPMGFRDDDQTIIGFDIDVAKEVCKRMGVELELQPINWKAKEQELNTKNIDCIWNGMSYSKERDEAFTLSKPYMENNQVAVVLAKSGVKKLSDLAGKTVAIQNGSTASDAMDTHEEFKDSLKDLVKVDDNVQAMMDLKVKSSDAVVMDEVVARYYTEKEPGIYKVLDESLSKENYVIGYRKGDEALRDEVQKYLDDMKKDGTLAKISTTWFGKDITIK